MTAAWAGNMAAASPPPLFAAMEPSVGSAATGNAARPAPYGVRRERRVVVDHTVIAPEGAAAPTVAISLFDGNEVLVELVRIEVRSPNNFTWFGRVRDYDRSDVVLSVVDGVLAGGIGLASSSSGEAAAYRLQPAGAGTVYLQELDPAQMPPEHPPGWTGEPPPGLLAPPSQPQAQGAFTPQADSGAQIDVMVVYSNETAAAAGSGIGAEIQYAIDRANLAYSNSGITTQLRLVTWGSAGYNESGDFNTDLVRLATVGDGYMDAVDNGRNGYAADVVALFIENSAYCGLGYLNATATSAFVVVNRGCAGGYLSLAHEIGHNFGARHDPYVDAATTPYAYGHGYVNLTGQWRTVLAYDNQCKDNGFSCARIPYFSTPGAVYLGAPVGTAATHDNARVHNTRAYTLANFRTAVVIVAPTVSTGAATSVTGTGAVLNGTVTSNGAVTGVTFNYGTTTSYGSTVTADGSPFAAGTSNAPVTVTIFGLAACTTYHFRIAATNSAGTTLGADNTFQTPCVTLPTAVTGSVSNVTPSGATLNGVVSSNAGSTSVTFQWGTSLSYGQYAAASGSPLAPNATSQPVSAAINGLAPCTTYHYRVTANNSAGTTFGADASFVTGGCASGPQVAANAPSNITLSGATLNGTVVSNGVPSTVTFHYGLTGSYGSVAVPAQSPVTTSGSPAAVNVTLAGLSCGTVYHWALNAASINGTAQTPDQVFVTATCPPGGAQPTAGTSPATAIGATVATLNGTVSSNGATTNVVFQYGIGNFAGTVTATPATLAVNASNQAVTATLTGLACATTYQYRVVASNSAGTGSGAGLTFTTAACNSGTPSTTALTSDANPAMAGSSVTLQATVTGVAPSGNVAFMSGGSAIAGCAAVPIAGSGNIKNAFCTIAGVPASGYDVSAVYAGDAGNQPSSSPPFVQQVVTGGPLTCSISGNPYGTLSVTGGSLNGVILTLTPPSTTVQLGNTPGNNDHVQFECPNFAWPANATLTVRSGAAGQVVVIKNTGSQATAIAGAITAQGANGAAAPQLRLLSPRGIALGAAANVTAASGLTLDALSNWTSGLALTNAGTVDGGAYLGLAGATIKGGGAFKGNSVDVHTFGNVNNPVSGAQYLGNSLQVSPSSGTDVALLLNAYGTAPQFINLKVNGNATVWMPSAWPSNFAIPGNSAPLPAGGTRPAGVGEPGYGGGSIILQATGRMTLSKGGADDFAFPGGIALKAGTALDLNGVSLNQGWTTTGKSFQGIYLEAPAITSATPVQVWSNDFNWTNFSVQPTGHFEVTRLKAQPNGTALFVPADTEAPHLNTYSTLIDASANLQCWTCLVNFSPIPVQ